MSLWIKGLEFPVYITGSKQSYLSFKTHELFSKYESHNTREINNSATGITVQVQTYIKRCMQIFQQHYKAEMVCKKWTRGEV